ncbi:MAG: DinB family protein [Anaerolineae bacterium]
MVLIDFSPVDAWQITLYDFAQRFSVDDLRSATNASIDAILAFIGDADDAQVTFIPDDPNADDPFAPPEERYLGWSLAHLVMHVTASSEEGAAYSAILARGIAYPREPRLRRETDWHTVTTRAQVIQRLEESRRMRLAALDMWPQVPHLDVFREVSSATLSATANRTPKPPFCTA